jgi:hypothetical protein
MLTGTGSLKAQPQPYPTSTARPASRLQPRPHRQHRTPFAMAVAVAAAWLPPAAARRSSLSSPRSPFAAPISIHVPRRAPPPCPSPLPQRSRLVVASAQFDFARGKVPTVSCFSHLLPSLALYDNENLVAVNFFHEVEYSSS